jgi:hypothetical protein
MNFFDGSTASSDIPLIRHAMISAPQSTPNTLPRPPFSDAPPITHAATASSSINSPTVVVEFPPYAVCMNPVSATIAPMSVNAPIVTRSTGIPDTTAASSLPPIA